MVSELARKNCVSEGRETEEEKKHTRMWEDSAISNSSTRTQKKPELDGSLIPLEQLHHYLNVVSRFYMKLVFETNMYT